MLRENSALQGNKDTAMTQNDNTSAVTHALMVTGSRQWAGPGYQRRMRDAFNELWRQWGSPVGTKPLLLSGHAAHGADAMAEALWQQAGWPIKTFPADWSSSRGAGLARNQEMAQYLARLAQSGTHVAVLAFHVPCDKPGCPQGSNQQLAPRYPGHWSHGTTHCRNTAVTMGLPVTDIFPPS